MRTARHAAALLAIAAGFALIAVLLMPTPGSARPATPGSARPAAPAPVAVVPAMHSILTPDQAYLAKLAPATELSGATAARLTEAGHLVCEGLTADVPVSVMSRTLMDRYALTGEEAMAVVNTAGVTLCH